MFGKTVFGGSVSGLGMGPDGAYQMAASQQQVAVTRTAHRTLPVGGNFQNMLPVTRTVARLDPITARGQQFTSVPSGIHSGGQNQRAIVIHGRPVIPAVQASQPTMQSEAAHRQAMMVNSGLSARNGVFNAVPRYAPALGGLGYISSNPVVRSSRGGTGSYSEWNTPYGIGSSPDGLGIFGG